MTERELQRLVLEVLRREGWIAYHTFDSRRSEPGFPDVIAIRGDRLLALECKTERGRVTQAQRRWLEAFAEVRGAAAYIVRPAADMDELAVLAGSMGE